MLRGAGSGGLACGSTPQWLTAEITRATGLVYHIQLEALYDEDLRELQSILRDLDLDHEKPTAVQQARFQTWR